MRASPRRRPTRSRTVSNTGTACPGVAPEAAARRWIDDLLPAGAVRSAGCLRCRDRHLVRRHDDVALGQLLRQQYLNGPLMLELWIRDDPPAERGLLVLLPAVALLVLSCRPATADEMPEAVAAVTFDPLILIALAVLLLTRAQGPRSPGSETLGGRGRHHRRDQLIRRLGDSRDVMKTPVDVTPDDRHDPYRGRLSTPLRG